MHFQDFRTVPRWVLSLWASLMIKDEIAVNSSLKWALTDQKSYQMTRYGGEKPEKTVGRKMCQALCGTAHLTKKHHQVSTRQVDPGKMAKWSPIHGFPQSLATTPTLSQHQEGPPRKGRLLRPTSGEQRCPPQSPARSLSAPGTPVLSRVPQGQTASLKVGDGSQDHNTSETQIPQASSKNLGKNP